MITNIVMLVKNRPRLTDQCLDSLFKNTGAGSFNLTIIDDESRSATGEILTEAVLWPNATVLRISRSKMITGQARNLGVYWVDKYWGRGDYLYLSDNDMFFTPGWLDKLTTEFARSELGGFKLLGGWNHPFLKPSPAGFSDIGRICFHDAVAGASQLMRWQTWDIYGPLDAHAPGVGQSEDWKMCQDIIKNGGRVGSVYPRLVFNCGLTNSLGFPSPGSDVMLAELKEAKQLYPSLYWE